VNPDSKIYIAGYRGLAGSAITRRLTAGGYKNLVLKKHSELDLVNQEAVASFFSKEKPEYVFLAAAKVGGINANNSYPAEFMQQNLAIQCNVIDSAYRFGVTKLLFLGSSCIYPKHAPQPIKEDYLLSGKLEPTNEPYAIAKIAGIKMCSSYNRQYGTNFISVMPTNLYGFGDNYDLQNSHVIPALIRKMHEAKSSHKAQVVIWGTGSPRREFLYSDDLADACVFLLEHYDAMDIGELINIGVGQDLTIVQLVEKVAQVVGFRGDFKFDDTKPDGSPQKLLDVSRLNALGWQAKTSLRDGLQEVYRDYLNRSSSSIRDVKEYP
jgi:GDP-L-fucose synthase